MSVYGIDLGTTYACIAKVKDDGTVEAIRNQTDQKTTLASAIFFDYDGNYIVGDAAKEAMADAPDRLCQFFKRYIGRPELLERARANEPNLYIIDGIERDPIALTALVLKKICAYCEEQGEIVRDAVITYPADFDLSQKEAMRKAAELVGINVLGMINDITAAAMNYACTQGMDAVDEQKVLLYHLGGGTCSTALMQLTHRENGELVIQMLGYNGDNELGGIEWDWSLEELVKRKFAEEAGCSMDDISQNVTLAIRSQVEKQKQHLTERTNVTFKFIDDDESRRKIPVTREEFDEVTSVHLSNTIELVKSVLSQNAMEPYDVDVVLLDGGSTLMPQVKAVLSKLFGEDKIVLSDPYQAAAKGAAIVALNIKNNLPELCNSIPLLDMYNFSQNTHPSEPATDHRGIMQILNYSPISVGIVFMDDFDEMGNAKYNVHNFLKVGDIVPCESELFDFCTNNEEQKSIMVLLVISFSRDLIIPVKKAAYNTFFTDDISIDLNSIYWRIPIHAPHARHTEVRLNFSMNCRGEMRLRAEIPETGECNELNLLYHQTYEIKRV